jgi:hypothetical protein
MWNAVQARSKNEDSGHNAGKSEEVVGTTLAMDVGSGRLLLKQADVGHPLL